MPMTDARETDTRIGARKLLPFSGACFMQSFTMFFCCQFRTCLIFYPESVNHVIKIVSFHWSLLVFVFCLSFGSKYTVSGKKRGHVIFNYKSRIPWSISIIFIPLETGMNTPQLHVI